MRFTIRIQPAELNELEIVNILEPGEMIGIHAGTRVDSDGSTTPMVFSANILRVEPGSPGETVVTLELPGWQLIPNVGRRVSPATMAKLRQQDRQSTLPVTTERYVVGP